MKDKLKEIATKTKTALSSAATLVGDLNGDGKVDEDDLRIASQWAKDAACSAAEEAVRLGKHALRSDMVKDAAAGAVAGAAIAAPVPFVGSVTGATVGAGLGIYKNLNKPTQQGSVASIPKDLHEELLKLDELRGKGLLNDEEFNAEKRRLLRERI
jgi:hypothetical protein